MLHHEPAHPATLSFHTLPIRQVARWSFKISHLVKLKTAEGTAIPCVKPIATRLCWHVICLRASSRPERHCQWPADVTSRVLCSFLVCIVSSLFFCFVLLHVCLSIYIYVCVCVCLSLSLSLSGWCACLSVCVCLCLCVLNCARQCAPA